MGQSGSRGVICCAKRDKEGLNDGSGVLSKAPQFKYVEAEACLPEDVVFMSYSPMHQRELDEARRLAIATWSEVRVYLLSEQGMGAAPGMTLTHRFRAPAGQQIDHVVFCEEELSRHLAVALGPVPESADVAAGGQEHVIKVFSCQPPMASPRSTSARRRDQEPEPAGGVVEWSGKSGGAVSVLRGHKAPIKRIAVNRPYMLSADVDGECILWQKNGWQKTNAFERRAAAALHKGGISDLILDRQFLYSAGAGDDAIRVWLLPELCQVLAIPLDLSEDMLSAPGGSATLLGELPRWASVGGAGGASGASFSGSGPVDAMPQAMPRRNRSAPVSPIGSPRADALVDSPGTQERSTLHLMVNILRRPISRWAGSSSIGRGAQLFPKTPRGCLFVGAVLREDCDVASTGAGILMEWNLGDKATLQSARVAHESPIVALVYGPYDNGPVVTADASGLFRVWEFSLASGLCLAQQIDLPVFPGSPSSMASLRPNPGAPILAVEPPRAVYAAVCGRLFVWERSKAPSDFLGEACVGARTNRA